MLLESFLYPICLCASRLSSSLLSSITPTSPIHIRSLMLSLWYLLFFHFKVSCSLTPISWYSRFLKVSPTPKVCCCLLSVVCCELLLQVWNNFKIMYFVLKIKQFCYFFAYISNLSMTLCIISCFLQYLSSSLVHNNIVNMLAAASSWDH